MTIRDEMHHQITKGLKNANFPIKTVDELVRSFPEGEKTKCEAEGVELTVSEVKGLVEEGDFPFNNAEEVAHVVLKRTGI